MAELAELKQMVLSFRVSELHVLLGFAGRNKSGRKQELTQRALGLVQKGCSLPVQIKIRELYRQIYPVGNRQGTSPPHKDVNMPRIQRHPGGLDYSTLNIRPALSQTGLPANPDVRLTHLPFYDMLAEIMKPSSLIPKNNGRMQETLFVFHLTPQQAQDITMSRDFRPGAKCEYTVQVQLRFCLLEPSCEQSDIFPSQIQVRVNNKLATLPNVIPTNKPNVEPKRPGRPVDITSLCRLSPTVSNAVTVTWAADFTRSFCVSIFLVRKLSSDILLARLRQFGNRHLDHTKALIQEKLAQDLDSEIATTSLRVSLMCPLGKVRIQMPCRASTCTHLQCFDAGTFLMMNERKPSWMCPVCDRPCPYDTLIIDGYFVDIFQQSPSCNDIMFHEDGSWSPIKPQKENSSQVILTTTSKSLVQAATSTPTLSSSLTSTPSLSTSTSLSVWSQTPAPAATMKPPPAKGPVIDLTVDSSDDDDDDDAVVPSDPLSFHPVINSDTPSPAAVTHVSASPSTGPASSAAGTVSLRSGSTLSTTTITSKQPSVTLLQLNRNGHGTKSQPISHSSHGTKSQPVSDSDQGTKSQPVSHSDQGTRSQPVSQNGQGTKSQPVSHSGQGTKSQPVSHSGQGTKSLPVSHSGQGTKSQPVSHSGQGTKSQPVSHSGQGTKSQPVSDSSRDSSPSMGDNMLRASPTIAQASSSSDSLQSQTLNLEAMSDADFDEFLKGLSWGV